MLRKVKLGAGREALGAIGVQTQEEGLGSGVAAAVLPPESQPALAPLLREECLVLRRWPLAEGGVPGTQGAASLAGETLLQLACQACWTEKNAKR